MDGWCWPRQFHCVAYGVADKKQVSMLPRFFPSKRIGHSSVHCCTSREMQIFYARAPIVAFLWKAYCASCGPPGKQSQLIRNRVFHALEKGDVSSSQAAIAGGSDDGGSHSGAAALVITSAPKAGGAIVRSKCATTLFSAASSTSNVGSVCSKTLPGSQDLGSE